VLPSFDPAGPAMDDDGRGPAPAIDDRDVRAFVEGRHCRLYRWLGGRVREVGARFAVWAPGALSVSVIGDFNRWDVDAHPARRRADDSGIWEADVGDALAGQCYKYAIRTRDGRLLHKADPFAVRAEPAPATASVLCAPDGHAWDDARWMRERAHRQRADAPVCVYEVHLGSWRRDEHGETLGYRALAPLLARYAADLGFTHVELLPVAEHPFYGSWGYQCTGYFAPTSRYGTAQDFKCFVDTLHQAGVGVILDWVPSHFPADAHGLAHFDGGALFEPADPRRALQPEWNSSAFDYARGEVRSFLLSSAAYWLDEFHADGLRVDAVASMLYLDYARRDGEWLPNPGGGRENLDAIAFLRELTQTVGRERPGALVVAEESTAWPGVTRPVPEGGLGFDLKWNMGWMHDTLTYLREDPIHRRWHHRALTFPLTYAFSERFMLPLSHDEVVHGKGSLLGRMPGDDWQRFANLRLLLGLQWASPGKKLLFMGAEFGQRGEWDHDRALDWRLLEHDAHRALQRWVHDLNRLYREEPAMHESDSQAEGFECVDGDDAERSTLAFVRRARGGSCVLVVANFTPVPRDNHLVAVPRAGRWRERLNSDASTYGGSGLGNLGAVDSVPVAGRGHFQSLTLRLPPLGLLVLSHEGTPS